MSIMTEKQFSSLPKYAQDRVRELRQQVREKDDIIEALGGKPTSIEIETLSETFYVPDDATVIFTLNNGTRLHINTLHKFLRMRCMQKPFERQKIFRLEPGGANVMYIWGEDAEGKS